MTTVSLSIREAQNLQNQALDPNASAVVTASAGSGKTTVLINRVIALLLAGAKPEKILCLTYTKAAAAEMANRLASNLAAWATLPQAELMMAVGKITSGMPDEELLARARRLFAEVLQAPGGLAIETIHAFCQRLLKRFPLESGVSPGFAVLDERAQSEALAEATTALILEGEESDELADAISAITSEVGHLGLEEVIADLAAKRGAFLESLTQHGGAKGAAKHLLKALGLSKDEEPDALLLEALVAPVLPEGDLKELLIAFQASDGKNDGKKADALAAFLAAETPGRVALYDQYYFLFFTKEGKVRDSFLVKKAAAAHPQALEIAQREADRLAALEDKRARLVSYKATAALYVLAEALFTRYQAIKRRLGALDYEDLIERAGALLSGEGRLLWVLYKLDGGLEHLLLDEAQDTSPAQWRLIERLTSEFHSGRGAYEEKSDRPRTVFAVGDAKQSIYSFQGADPQSFVAGAQELIARAHAAKQSALSIELLHSFRSAPPVLEAVDRTFAEAPARQGLDFVATAIRHQATREKAAGLVEIWPAEGPAEKLTFDAWEPPTKRAARPKPDLLLAAKLADKIASWCQAEGVGPGHEAYLPARGRAIHPGDILVLVRRRGAFVEALSRELKRRAIPVAGLDRLQLAEHIAVMDLLALADALLLPEDDLTLATVLKGPLIGLSEEQLFALAQGREGTLWAQLQDHAAKDESYAAALEKLKGWMAEIDFIGPFEFFAALLGRGGARRLFRARLGEEAKDALTEFLNLALEYEKSGATSLQGFLSWFRAGGVEIKRDLEAAGLALRIMTVHGAKGLQAPIVILPDSCKLPQNQDRLFVDGERKLIFWNAGGCGGTFAEKLANLEEDARLNEYRRLLYVAMTRAEDRLYLAGWHGSKIAEGSWYDLIERALKKACKPSEDSIFGASLRLQSTGPSELDRPGRAPTPELTAAPLPAWVMAAAPADPDPPRPLSPSRPEGEAPTALSPRGEGDRQRFLRGRLIHRLLQSLPDLAQEERQSAALRYLEQAAIELSAKERQAICDEALAVMTHPGLASAFGPGSRAEVPLVGLAKGRRVAGQVDRLWVQGDKVLILDYKTNRPPPEKVEDVAPAYFKQMALYQILMQQVYPDRTVECWLIWTLSGQAMRLPESLLAGHLA